MYISKNVNGLVFFMLDFILFYNEIFFMFLLLCYKGIIDELN